jgi:hypothetical protein
MAKKIKFTAHIGTMIPCLQGIFRVSQEKKKKKLVVRHFRKTECPAFCSVFGNALCEIF